MGWGNTNPTSCYASGSLSTLLHELDGVGVGVGWGGVIQLRRNNKLSGLSLETAHVDGLSSLYVHSNLGLDCVLDAYAAYMHKMLDQLNPNKMFQNLDWLKPPAL